MNSAEDFLIENGVLKKYVGSSGDIVIPDSVTAISDRAFYGCDSLTSITIPDSVTEISEYAFSACSSLTEILVSLANHSYSSTDGILMNLDQSKVIRCPIGKKGTVKLPDSVTAIGDWAFYDCDGLTSITIPDGVTEIGRGAFSWCRSLTRMIVPDGVTEIGEEAFHGIRSIQSFKIPDKTLKEIGIAKFKKIIDIDSLESALIAEPDFFDGLLKDKLVSRVRKKFEELAQECIKHEDVIELRNLLKLKSKSKVDISIVDGLISYAQGGDVECPNAVAYLLEYKHKHYPDDVVQKLNEENVEKELGIRERTVSDWRKIFKFSIKNGEIKILNYLGTDSIVEIPERIGKNTVTEIGERAFSRRLELTELFIPDTVVRVGRSAFECCENLRNLHVGTNLTQIGPYSFHGCPRLQNEKGFVIINHQLLRYWGFGTEVVIPDGITHIGGGAFSFKSAITSVQIPDSVVEIGEKAFQGCEGLADSNGFIIVRNTLYGYLGEEENVVVPDCVTHISGSVFEGYQSCGDHVQLKTLKIPASVTEIYLDRYSYDYIPAKKIIGKVGSYAEKFAEENGIRFAAE